ncbi:MucBP domain-containing protein [Oscillospiraceae bacterium NTUH-002-81]|nr:MucBP domain-containing protein [Oscillospiraceae bacterium NTUH-002-81]
MKKKRWIPGILLALFLGMGTVSLAADAGPTVTFDGKQIVYSNYEVTDFGDAFDNMLPSETRTQEIILKNADQRAVDFYMSAQVLKSLQEIGEDNAFYHVSLDLVQNGTFTRIYGDGQELATVGGSNNGARGLKELDDTLDDYYLLAVLKGGETAKLQLTVELDGESGDNVYMARDGKIQFDFRVQYDDPKAPEVITVKGDPVVHVVKKVQTVYRGVKTGDQAPVAILLGVLVLSVILMIVVIVRRKKKTGNRMWTAVLLAGVLFAAIGKPARAAELPVSDSPRTYTITYRPGRIGTFAAGTADGYRSYAGVTDVKETKTGSIAITLLAGSYLPDPPQSQVIVKDEYAGRYMMNTAWLPGAEEQTVTRDRDYVVDYSAISEEVGYVVRYVDTADNQEVAPAFHGRGNVGETISQVAKTVDGYRYDSYTKTIASLDADGTKNRITFYYTATASGNGEQHIIYVPGEETTRVDTTENIVYIGGGQTTGTGVGTAAGTAGTATGEGGQAGELASEEAAADGQTTEPDAADNTGAEDGLTDIPDEQIPLGDIQADAGAQAAQRPILPYVCGIVAAAAVIAFVVIRKKRKAE